MDAGFLLYYYTVPAGTTIDQSIAAALLHLKKLKKNCSEWTIDYEMDNGGTTMDIGDKLETAGVAREDRV